MVMCTRYRNEIITRTRIVYERSYKNFAANLFLHKVKNLPMWQVCCSEDPEEAVSILTHFLSDILDRLAPMKTYQVRRNDCPWLNNETKSII